jgi:hypothetical protein
VCSCHASLCTNLLLQDYIKQLREFAAAQKFDKKQQQGLMQFAAFVKAAYDEIGVAALDLTMPYDQAAILTENLAYMQSSLQLTELTLHLASEPNCPGGERVVSGVSPGHPALVLE